MFLTTNHHINGAPEWLFALMMTPCGDCSKRLSWQNFYLSNSYSIFFFCMSICVVLHGRAWECVQVTLIRIGQSVCNRLNVNGNVFFSPVNSIHEKINENISNTETLYILSFPTLVCIQRGYTYLLFTIYREIPKHTQKYYIHMKHFNIAYD